MHVEAGVSQEELRQILTQLRNLVKTNAPPPIPQPPIPAPSWQTQPSFPPPPPVPQVVPQLYPLASTSAVKLEQQAVISPSQPTESASVATVPDNIANLLSTLLKAGVVSASGTPLGAGSTVTEISAEPSKPVDQRQEAFRAYRNNILPEITLSNFDSIK
jgi:pre-mRNA cleavage complex 2 protein Pcf11